MIQRGVFNRHKRNIFTDNYPPELAKAGICFTFGAHKVRIRILHFP